MAKNLFKIIIIFIVGAGGGIFADQILWPYFVERPLFYQYRLEQAPIYMTEKNEIAIEENTALQNAVEKVGKSVVGIRTIIGKRIIEGSGAVVSSDGLVLTLAELVPQGGKSAFFIDGKTPAYQILKRDFKSNLALIKIEETNLSTVGFAEFGSLRFGQRVFLAGALLKKEGVLRTVNEGIIKTFDKTSLKTNIFEKTVLRGSPLFNIKGELVGINNINSKEEVVSIPINIIRDFSGF